MPLLKNKIFLLHLCYLSYLYMIVYLAKNVKLILNLPDTWPDIPPRSNRRFSVWLGNIINRPMGYLCHHLAFGCKCNFHDSTLLWTDSIVKLCRVFAVWVRSHAYCWRPGRKKFWLPGVIVRNCKKCSKSWSKCSCSFNCSAGFKFAVKFMLSELWLIAYHLLESIESLHSLDIDIKACIARGE